MPIAPDLAALTEEQIARLPPEQLAGLRDYCDRPIQAVARARRALGNYDAVAALAVFVSISLIFRDLAERVPLGRSCGPWHWVFGGIAISWAMVHYSFAVLVSLADDEVAPYRKLRSRIPSKTPGTAARAPRCIGGLRIRSVLLLVGALTVGFLLWDRRDRRVDYDTVPSCLQGAWSETLKAGSSTVYLLTESAIARVRARSGEPIDEWAWVIERVVFVHQGDPNTGQYYLWAKPRREGSPRSTFVLELTGLNTARFGEFVPDGVGDDHYFFISDIKRS